jgi:NADH dehydrogenase/NADH:ubiquinone oxidoreductase subunit G
VVLPLAHPYEQDGSFTNLEGRVQVRRAGARLPDQTLADWELAVKLADRLNVPVPSDLAAIRAELSTAYPDYARVLLAEQELARA